MGARFRIENVLRSSKSKELFCSKLGIDLLYRNFPFFKKLQAKKVRANL